MTTAEIILTVLVILLIIAVAAGITLFILHSKKNKNNVPVQTDTKVINDTITEQFKLINESLNAQQKTANENINTSFEKSFKKINEQLESLNKSTGEIKNYGETADELLRAMKGSKISGIFGETQLGDLLLQFLAPDQFEKNFQAKLDSQERVEYAVKIPGNNDGEFIYVPIDSKFPMTVFIALTKAQKDGNKDVIDAATKELKSAICKMAKDIETKYINFPRTTSYGIMFLPTEALYLEAIKLNLLDELREKNHVTMCGPSTLSAILMSFKMGFQTFKMQNASANIMKTHQALKTEFRKLKDEMEIVDKSFAKANKAFDKMTETRFKKIEKAVVDVDALPGQEADNLIGVDDNEVLKKEEE